MHSSFRLLFIPLLLALAACAQDAALAPATPGAAADTPAALDRQNVSGKKGSARRYSFVVPAGSRGLVVSTAGGSGNADLYMRQGSRPTLKRFSCRSRRSGNGERCTLSSPKAGTYHVMVYGKRAYKGLALTASYQTAAPEPAPEPTPPAPAPQPVRAFDVELIFDASVPTDKRPVIERAAQRWEEVIAGDIPGTFVNKPAGWCDTPAYSGTIDDIVVHVKAEAIDGRGGTLAYAGPCLITSRSRFSSYGRVVLDSDDLELPEFYDVVLHELGHVLGIGTLWEIHDLIDSAATNCQSGGRYLGERATQAWRALSGSGYAPVDRCGGHWDERTFNHELMTPLVDRGALPLSALTAASLEDIGYTVNRGATESYSLPSCAPACNALSPLSLASREVLLEPSGVIGPDGSVSALP